MKRTFFFKTAPLAVLISALVLTASFAQTRSGNGAIKSSDTVPKAHKQVRDLDDALLELDNGEAEIEQIDGEKIAREIREALKGLDVDMAKMKRDLAKELKEIDVQKINADVQQGLAEMQNSLKEIDVEKIKKEVQESLAKVDMTKIKAEVEKVKDIDFSKMKKELKAIQPQVENAMREAKVSIDKARVQLNAYKSLVNALDKDGYLKKDGNYKIEYKAGELTVNGKTLSADAVKKYNEFLGKKDFTLQKEDDDFNINNK